MRLSRRLGLVLALAGAVPSIAVALPTPDYLVRAGQSDLFEHEAAKLVLDDSRNPAIRDFATRMIDDHAASAKAVAAAAASAGFHPNPPELSARQLRMLADLKDARGARRDALYVEQQKEVHGDALKLQQDYALTGGIAPVKAAAARIVPVVQQHIAMLDTLRP